MKVGLYLEVKFRAFGITFGNVRQSFEVGPAAPFITPVDGGKPEGASKVFDVRGVKLWAWAK